MIEWALICAIAAVILFVLEVFVPTGGAAGLLGTAATAAFVILLFMHDTTYGLAAAIVVIMCIPVVLYLIVRFWPDTPIGRMMTLRSEPRHSPADHGDAGIEATEEAETTLVGKRGRSVTPLRPVGVCVIDGRRRDCISESGTIPAEVEVEVVSADGMQVKVRQV